MLGPVLGSALGPDLDLALGPTFGPVLTTTELTKEVAAWDLEGLQARASDAAALARERSGTRRGGRQSTGSREYLQKSILESP